MIQPGRKYSAGDVYRYGFNGKENDNEVKGEGSQQDYGMRIYDPRLGRFLSVDPLARKFPCWTPYQFASNTPVQAIDLDGEEALVTVDKEKRKITVEVRVKYTDDQEKQIKDGKLSIEKFKADFDYYWKALKDGKSQAMIDIQANTGLTPEMIEEKQQGGVARGGDGYFTTKINGQSYDISYNLTFSKDLDANDPTVNTLVLTDRTDYAAGTRTFNIDLKNYNRHHWGHEPGHTMGLLDTYKPIYEKYGVTPKAINGTYKKDGILVPYNIGEIMGTPSSNLYVSNKSIVLSLTPAIEVATNSKESFVRIHLGSSYDTAESVAKGEYLRNKTYDLDEKPSKKKKKKG